MYENIIFRECVLYNVYIYKFLKFWVKEYWKQCAKEKRRVITKITWKSKMKIVRQGKRKKIFPK